jgi:site-specific DNA recombinase
MLTEYNRRKTAESSDELNIAKRELESVNQKINKVIQLVSESDVSIDTVKDEMKKLEERKYFVEAQIREISKDTNTLMITEETIIDLVNRSKEFVQTRNIPECRNFIDSYVGKVVIYGDKVEVQFKIYVPDNDDTISPLASEERIKVLQNGYKSAV